MKRSSCVALSRACFALLRARHVLSRPKVKASRPAARHWPFLGGAAAVLALAACAPPTGVPEVEFRMPVEAEEIVTATVEDLVVATGTLRAREIVRLHIETPGHLQVGRDGAGERLAEGSVVAAEQIVARVTGEDVRLHARLDSTRRTMEAAAAQLARRRDLFDVKLASEEELHEAEERLERTRFEYDRSVLNAAKATLKTPIAGTVLHLARNENGNPMADGQLVVAGFVVAEVGPLDQLVADVDLIGPELARVRPGQTVRIRHYAFTDLEIGGRVVRLSPTMDPVETHVPRRSGRGQHRHAIAPRHVRGGDRGRGAAPGRNRGAAPSGGKPGRARRGFPA